MTIHKDFNFDEDIAKYLEERAKEKSKTQTKLIEELLEKDRIERQRVKKLEALEKLKNSAPANIGNIDMQQIRIEKALHHAK